jgi:hypothetical protein
VPPTVCSPITTSCPRAHAYLGFVPPATLGTAGGRPPGGTAPPPEPPPLPLPLLPRSLRSLLLPPPVRVGRSVQEAATAAAAHVMHCAH